MSTVTRPGALPCEAARGVRVLAAVGGAVISTWPQLGNVFICAVDGVGVRRPLRLVIAAMRAIAARPGRDCFVAALLAMTIGLDAILSVVMAGLVAADPRLRCGMRGPSRVAVRPQLFAFLIAAFPWPAPWSRRRGCRRRSRRCGRARAGSCRAGPSPGTDDSVEHLGFLGGGIGRDLLPVGFVQAGEDQPAALGDMVPGALDLQVRQLRLRPGRFQGCPGSRR